RPGRSHGLDGANPRSWRGVGVRTEGTRAKRKRCPPTCAPAGCSVLWRELVEAPRVEHAFTHVKLAGVVRAFGWRLVRVVTVGGMSRLLLNFNSGDRADLRCLSVLVHRGRLAESSNEGGHVLVPLESLEPTLRGADRKRDPALDHRVLVTPALDVAGHLTNASHQVLDRVGGRERAREQRRKAKLEHGERLFEALAQAGGSVVLAVVLEPGHEGLELLLGRLVRAR